MVFEVKEDMVSMVESVGENNGCTHRNQILIKMEKEDQEERILL